VSGKPYSPPCYQAPRQSLAKGISSMVDVCEKQNITRNSSSKVCISYIFVTALASILYSRFNRHDKLKRSNELKQIDCIDLPSLRLHFDGESEWTECQTALLIYHYR